MSPESRRLAGILLVVLPTVAYGGASLLTLLVRDPRYQENALRQDLFRAGHAHAAVLLTLSLILLLYVDEAQLSPAWKSVARHAAPAAAILMPLGFFFSVLSPLATAPSGVLYLTYVGGMILALGLVVLGVGLLRRRRA